MATLNKNCKRQIDEVAMDGVIREQILKEESTNKGWNQRWGFTKDFHKLCIDVAASLGISESEYRVMTGKRVVLKKPAVDELESKYKPSDSIPVTSSGFIGWRSKDLKCSLEVCGPLYISPRLTMDPPDVENLSTTQIMLG